MPFRDTDDFLLEKAKEDPTYWEELAEKYPVNSEYDEDRFAMGEPPKRRRNRNGLSGGVPKNKRRKFDDEEWELVQKNKRQYYRDWEEDHRYAKELADEGM